MTQTDYKQARDRARIELRNLINRRANLDAELSTVNTRIAEVSQAVSALDLLVGDGASKQTELMMELAGLNLTDAVLEILRQSETHLTPMEISTVLRRAKYRLQDYTNPQASIHTMLRRLVQSGQADTITKDGKMAFRLLDEG